MLRRGQVVVVVVMVVGRVGSCGRSLDSSGGGGWMLRADGGVVVLLIVMVVVVALMVDLHVVVEVVVVIVLGVWLLLELETLWNCLDGCRLCLNRCMVRSVVAVSVNLVR